MLSLSWSSNSLRLMEREKAHYIVSRRPSMDPILSYLNPFPNPTARILKINFNIILPATPETNEKFLFAFGVAVPATIA